jgi:phosphate transport system permease protein
MSSFNKLVVVMASMVALILISILVVVFWGSLESMGAMD